MPMPVSVTVNATTERRACERLVGRAPAAVRQARCTLTAPRSVNLNALDSRFFITWRRRCGSVAMLGGSPGASSTEKATPLSSATGLKSAPGCRAARHAAAR